MIAVFVKNNEDFNNMYLYPKRNFIKILHHSNVDGFKFNGVILHDNWQKNKSTVEAFNILRSVQPELFK